jgi:hypothetical protein
VWKALGSRLQACDLGDVCVCDRRICEVKEKEELTNALEWKKRLEGFKWPEAILYYLKYNYIYSQDTKAGKALDLKKKNVKG